MLKRRSVWGGCKRSLYGAPEIWNNVREDAMGIQMRDEVCGNYRAEFLLACVMCYANYRIQVQTKDDELMRLACKYWEEIDEMDDEVNSKKVNSDE